MTTTGEFTAIFAVARDEDGAWDYPHWCSLVRPNAEGELHHGSRGATLPATVIVQHGDEPAALAEAFAYNLDNQYCWDCEYYLVLRIRAIVNTDAWSQLPWAALAPGDVFFAYDKFHGIDYSRTADDEAAMSYGGDWDDLQSLVDAHHPRPALPRTPARVSDATLLRAARAGDVAQVRALLAAGGSPDAGLHAPGAALRAVSVDRDSSALFDAVSSGCLPIVELLLAAGATVDGRPGGLTPLHCALLQRHVSLVPLLLRYGADPDLVRHGRSARTIAAELGLADLLPDPHRGPT